MVQKVAYLLGSGATHGVVQHSNNLGLLTRDIQQHIRERLEAEKPGFTDKIWNEIVKVGRDVEHLISVLDSQYKYDMSNSVRDYYHRAISEITARIPTPLQPNLYTVLVDLHWNSRLSETEELLCFMSLNYEDILERSIEAHLARRVDYILETTGRALLLPDGKTIPVLKLHGSFNWQNSRPVNVRQMSELPTSKDTLWIPPGLDKKKENYPFNLLWGRAVEYISQADVLRIIGCSLSRNDWGLIPILYAAQSLYQGGGLRIEIVDYFEIAGQISNSYNYLSVVGIDKLDEIMLYERQSLLPNEGVTAETYFSWQNSEKINCFEKWLDAKIEYLYTDDPFTENSVMREDLLNKSEAKIASRYYSKI